MDFDYRQHPKIRDNGDGTWTVRDGLDRQDWTIRQVGAGHFVGDPEDGNDQSGGFAGSFNEVAFNILGWEL